MTAAKAEEICAEEPRQQALTGRQATRSLEQQKEQLLNTVAAISRGLLFTNYIMANIHRICPVSAKNIIDVKYILMMVFLLIRQQLTFRFNSQHKQMW